MLLITKTMISFLVHLQAGICAFTQISPLKAESYGIKKDTSVCSHAGNCLSLVNMIYLCRICSWIEIPLLILETAIRFNRVWQLISSVCACESPTYKTRENSPQMPQLAYIHESYCEVSVPQICIFVQILASQWVWFFEDGHDSTSWC